MGIQNKMPKQKIAKLSLNYTVNKYKKNNFYNNNNFHLINDFVDNIFL